MENQLQDSVQANEASKEACESIFKKEGEKQVLYISGERFVRGQGKGLSKENLDHLRKVYLIGKNS